MTARGELEDVLGRASWGYDENDVDLIVEQFADDGMMTLQIGRDGATVGPFEGREKLRALHADSIAGQSDQRRHNISNVIVVDESPDTATTTCNLTMLSIEGGAIRVLTSGWYRDEFVRTGERWLISSRHLYLDLPY